jgi:hypothetical protein
VTTLPRPEKPITATGPEGTFAASLRQVHVENGRPKLRTMSARSGVSIAALSKAASGDTFPTWASTRAYIIGCGITDPVKLETTLTEFKKQWTSTRKTVELRKAAAADSTVVSGTPRTNTVSSLTATLPTIAPVQRNVAFADLTATIGISGAGIPAAVTGAGTDPLPVTVCPGPRPGQISTLPELVKALNRMVTDRGHTIPGLMARIGASNLPTLSHKSSKGLVSGMTVRDVLTGRRRPTRDVIVRIVDACGGTPHDTDTWVAAYLSVRAIERRAQTELERLKKDLRQEGLIDKAPSPPDRHGRPGIHRADERLRTVLLCTAGSLGMAALGALIAMWLQGQLG